MASSESRLSPAPARSSGQSSGGKGQSGVGSTASAELGSACVAATRRGAPILLEFTADWCKDCRTLTSLAGVSPLREELAAWQRVMIDVDDERYDAVLSTFEVEAIARWVLLAPGGCDEPVTEWARFGDRVIEPTSEERLSAAALAEWLQTRRLEDRTRTKSTNDG